MNTYTWFLIFNLTEFEALGIESKEYEYVMGSLGLKTILVTKGNAVSLTFEGIMLSVNLNDVNPFEFEDYAVFLHPDTDDVYLGVPVVD